MSGSNYYPDHTLLQRILDHLSCHSDSVLRMCLRTRSVSHCLGTQHLQLIIRILMSPVLLLSHILSLAAPDLSAPDEQEDNAKAFAQQAGERGS